MEKKLWVLDCIFITYFIFLSFFEKPFWCSQMGHKMSNDCSEDIYGNEYNLLLSFDLHQNYVFLITTFIMIYFNIKFYISYMNLKKVTRLFKSRRKLRLVSATFLNAFHIMFYFMARDNILNIDGCALARTFFLFLMIDVLFEHFEKVLGYFRNFYEVFILFFIDWLLMAAIIEVLFISMPSYYDDKDYYSFNFGNYFKSCFSVFVFFTGNNSPELLMAKYPRNSGITLFFISIIWINNILITGLIIGLSYYKMKLVMSKEIE